MLDIVLGLRLASANADIVWARGYGYVSYVSYVSYTDLALLKL